MLRFFSTAANVKPTGLRFVLLRAILTLLILLAGCSSPTEPQFGETSAAHAGSRRRRPVHPPAQLSEFFTVEIENERFVMMVTDAETIRLARENFEGRNEMHPTGRIARGDGGYNQPWSWHFVADTVRMADFSIEACDGRPSYVEENPEQFLEIGYCPWNARVVKVGR